MRFPAALALSLTFAGLLGASSLAANATPVGNKSASEAKARAFADVRNLDHHVLRLALDAVTCARETGRIDEGGDRLLTVIDYSKASTQRRLWVLDLDRERLLFEELVAHGQAAARTSRPGSPTAKAATRPASACSAPPTPTSAPTATRCASTASKPASTTVPASARS